MVYGKWQVTMLAALLISHYIIPLSAVTSRAMIQRPTGSGVGRPNKSISVKKYRRAGVRTYIRKFYGKHQLTN